MSEPHQFLNIRPILFNLTHQFHLGKLNPSLIGHIIPIKVMVHVKNTIEKILRIQ